MEKQRQILHVDVNNAFLSWTALDRLNQGEKVDIREIEAVIGGDETKRSGIVLDKSMKAKRKGVCTGETLYQARLKCPNLQVFKGDYKSYRKHSDDLYKILLQYTEKIERFSIDECFLDMTNYLGNDTLLNKAYEINRRVKQELGFTVNVGVAHTLQNQIKFILCLKKRYKLKCGHYLYPSYLCSVKKHYQSYIT